MEDIVQYITGLDDITQIFYIIISTFASEDITLIVSATAYFTKVISVEVFYIGIFLGAILSDFAIYLAGRFLGANRDYLLFLNLKELRKKAERYKAQGFSFLVITRFTPGLRAPSLFAAGLANYNVKNFLIAKAVSIFILLAIVEVFGTVILSYINDNKLALATFFISLTIILYIIYRTHTGHGYKVLFYKILGLRYFEFWPAWLFYLPVSLYYILLGIKNWNFMLPLYANPAIKYGGFIGEDKDDILKLLDGRKSYTLKFSLIKGNLSLKKKLETLTDFLHDNKLTYPVILKPNTGQRGKAVKLAVSEEQAKEILKNSNFNILAQEYCAYKKEAGIFFYYDVLTGNPNILSITLKETPNIIGDGKHTIKQLILKDKRARYIAGTYLNRLKGTAYTIPKKGEVIPLVFAGNHAQGAIFTDGKRYINKELISVFDELANSINGFFIGRFDVKYSSIEELRSGKNFKIIEINGSGSEVTHIYDKKVSLFGAYRALFKQWRLIFQRGKYCKENKMYSYDIDEFASDYFKYLKEARNYDISS